MTTNEREIAIREGHKIHAETSYFTPRPQLDFENARHVFCEGFDRGYIAATTEANKRIAELEHELICKECELMRQCDQTNNAKVERDELQASNHDLREVLENVLSWVVYQPVACHGMKCRESVCESCCGEEAAEIASKQAGEAVTIARKTLSATPAESLQAHDDELIERCAEVCIAAQPDYADNSAYHECANAVRALKGTS